MKITRHHVEAPDGENFYFVNRDKAERFAAKTGGSYKGIVEFANIQEFVDRHS